MIIFLKTATSDMWIVENRIGIERAKQSAYVWKSLLETGIQHLPFSSDFPVEDYNPLKGIYAAVTRTDEKGDSPHGSQGWFPLQKVSLYQAIKGFTIDAAYTAFMENQVISYFFWKSYLLIHDTLSLF